MIFIILFTVAIILGLIFILFFFAILIQTSVMEIKMSIREKDTFLILFGICAIGIEIICTIIIICVGFNFIGMMFNKFF